MRFNANEVLGTTASWNKDLCRIAVTFRKSDFEGIKTLAVSNNRSISAEIRTIVEAAISSSKKTEAGV